MLALTGTTHLGLYKCSRAEEVAYMIKEELYQAAISSSIPVCLVVTVKCPTPLVDDDVVADVVTDAMVEASSLVIAKELLTATTELRVETDVSKASVDDVSTPLELLLPLPLPPPPPLLLAVTSADSDHLVGLAPVSANGSE